MPFYYLFNYHIPSAQIPSNQTTHQNPQQNKLKQWGEIAHVCLRKNVRGEKEFLKCVGEVSDNLLHQ